MIKRGRDYLQKSCCRRHYWQYFDYWHAICFNRDRQINELPRKLDTYLLTSDKYWWSYWTSNQDLWDQFGNSHSLAY